MFRSLFRLLVSLHPRAFRERFAGEMLSIFDHSDGKMAALGLVADAFLSLLRQWGFRPAFWNDAVAAEHPQVASAGAPTFFVLESHRPRGIALIHGGILSILFFVVISLAVLNSRGSQVQPRLPRIKPETLRGTPAKKGPDNLTAAMRAKNSYQPPGAQLSQPQENPAETPQPTTLRNPPRIAMAASPSPILHPTVAPAPPDANSSSPQISWQISTGDESSPPAPPQGAASPAPPWQQAYEGAYVVDPPISFNVVITVEDSQLFLNTPRKSKTAIVRCSGFTFRYKDSSNCGITFSRFARGEFQQLNLEQGDSHLVVARRRN